MAGKAAGVPGGGGPVSSGAALDGFSAATRAWFEGAFAVPTQAQAQAWRAIGGGGAGWGGAPLRRPPGGAGGGGGGIGRGGYGRKRGRYAGHRADGVRQDAGGLPV